MSLNCFSQLGLDSQLLTTLDELGHKQPFPIQSAAIPMLLAGHDVLAQAQTGSGKTAAFVLPILSQIDRGTAPQALIIAPTRELAIQVAEAIKSYAQHSENLRVCTIYGGQDYTIQLKALKRQPQIIVGTPGRLLDHIQRGSLKLQSIRNLVLDEADEMLKMGFMEDMDKILQQLPSEHQTALFSATIPSEIHKLAKKYLNNPKKIKLEVTQEHKNNITQSYIKVAYKHKTEALQRLLEVENMQAAIIFTRTKKDSEELALSLQAAGYRISALNGDMPQTQREKVIQRLRLGSLNIVVATDVAARGIDIDRISHVINYDMPFDVESYVHRIGRTGRAGRQGKAILFVTGKEHGLLRAIETRTKQSIQLIEAPSRQDIIDARQSRLGEKLLGVINKSKQLAHYEELIANLSQQHDIDPQQFAAALAYLLEQSNPLPKHENLPTATDNHSRNRNRRTQGQQRSKGYQHRKKQGQNKSRHSKSAHRSSTARKPLRAKSPLNASHSMPPAKRSKAKKAGAKQAKRYVAAH